MTQYACVRLHATDENAGQTQHDADQQANVDGQNDDDQECSQPNGGIQMRHAPELEELLHLHQHSLERDDYDAGQNALKFQRKQVSYGIAMSVTY